LFSLILAAVGLYGVLSYNVSVRQRELSIRTALGASAREIVWLIVREGMSVTVVGLLVGLAAAAAVAQVIQSLLFGVSPLDAVTFIVASGLLAAVAIGACLLTAFRAAATDPITALKAQ
jgi:putative ABC transport system permease protein